MPRGAREAWCAAGSAQAEAGGIAVTLIDTVISHASKPQHVVSLSTSEAQYIAAGDEVKEAMFIRAVHGARDEWDKHQGP